MLVYRVEHHEKCSGPFQSEFFLNDPAYDEASPYYWGQYLPVFDDCYDDHYDYGSTMRRFACHDMKDILKMNTGEGKCLADLGWVVRVYEVPDCAVFIAQSGKQCVFDFACAVLKLTLDLIAFLMGKEIDYVPA